MILAIMLSAGFAACSSDDDEDDKYSEFSSLYSTVDRLISDLPYSGSGGTKSRETYDGNYTVTLLGRLIVVKKNHVTGPTYNEVLAALKAKYKSNSKVSDIYLNNGGTITIDCRK